MISNQSKCIYCVVAIHLNFLWGIAIDNCPPNQIFINLVPLHNVNQINHNIIKNNEETEIEMIIYFILKSVTWLDPIGDIWNIVIILKPNHGWTNNRSNICRITGGSSSCQLKDCTNLHKLYIYRRDSSGGTCHLEASYQPSIFS